MGRMIVKKIRLAIIKPHLIEVSSLVNNTRLKFLRYWNNFRILCFDIWREKVEGKWRPKSCRIIN